MRHDRDTFSNLRILHMQLEFSVWRGARHWSYTGGFGMAEGLRANRVSCVSIPTAWLRRAKEICGRDRFDQVWIEVVHNALDEKLLEWVATLAPVRVGLMAESLEYSPEEYTEDPLLIGRREKVEKRLEHMTHVVAVDEKDVERINRSGLARAMWCPQTVPARFIRDDPPPGGAQAVFCGALYGRRKSWLGGPELESVLVRLQPPEAGTIYPLLFDALHYPVRPFIKFRLCCYRTAVAAYFRCLRSIREKCFRLWLDALRGGCAVVNLPHWVKGYPGRVVEGMAAGCPVISWAVPDCPRNTALFEDEREILLFSGNDPLELADMIGRIRSDPSLARRLAENARRKVRRLHTSEIRVRQILDWIETGQEPDHV